MNFERDPFVQLQCQMRDALRKQHPEWIEADGASPLCDIYERRLGEMLDLFSRNQTRDSADSLGLRRLNTDKRS